MGSTPIANDRYLAPKEKEPYASMVDPCLLEALQNPPHRLTILRMELDIKRFLQNSDQQQFEFQHFPASYLHLAAHRVAQHYGLRTMVQESLLDGLGNRVVARKLAESMYPAVCLSEIPSKQFDNKGEQLKIVIKQRPNKTSSNEASQMGIKSNTLRTVEERKEEYDRTCARIFNMPTCHDSEGISSQNPLYGKDLCLCRDENEVFRYSMIDSEKIPKLPFSRKGIKIALTRIMTGVMKDILRALPLIKLSVWHLLICRSFSLHLCSIILLFLNWVRYQGQKLLSAVVPLSGALFAMSGIRHPGVMPFCNGQLMLWSMDNRMINLDMLFYS